MRKKNNFIEKSDGEPIAARRRAKCGRRLTVVLLVISVVFLLLGGLSFGLSCRNLKRLAALPNRGYERNAAVVTYTTENDVPLTLIFGELSVKVNNAHLLNAADRLETAALVVRILNEDGIRSSQTVSDFMGELTFHKACYMLGIGRENTRDADLDYFGDIRPAVRLSSRILGVMGL